MYVLFFVTLRSLLKPLKRLQSPDLKVSLRQSFSGWRPLVWSSSSLLLLHKVFLTIIKIRRYITVPNIWYLIQKQSWNVEHMEATNGEAWNADDIWFTYHPKPPIWNCSENEFLLTGTIVESLTQPFTVVVNKVLIIRTNFFTLYSRIWRHETWNNWRRWHHFTLSQNINLR